MIVFLGGHSSQNLQALEKKKKVNTVKKLHKAEQIYPWHQVIFIRILFKKVCKNHHVRTKTSESKTKMTKKLSQSLGSSEDSNSSMVALLPLHHFVLFTMALPGGLNQLKN